MGNYAENALDKHLIWVKTQQCNLVEVKVNSCFTDAQPRVPSDLLILMPAC